MNKYEKLNTLDDYLNLKLTKEEGKSLINYLSSSNDGLKLYVLSMLYKNGLFTEKSYESYLFYLTKSSSTYPFASYELAKEYLINKEYYEAYYYMRKAADMGLSDAMYDFSYFFFSGEKIGISKDEALNYLISSADKGNPKALYLLGTFYLCGLYVKMNKEKALSLIKDASDLGYDKAIDLYRKLTGE